MKNFILGIIFGIALATIGVSGLASLLDSGVDHIKAAILSVSSK